MLSLLNVLDDLSYIIECVAIDYLGEGKAELNNLCDKLINGVYSIPDRDQILEGLQDSLSCLREGRKNDGASKLSQVSRQLWVMANEWLEIGPLNIG